MGFLFCWFWLLKMLKGELVRDVSKYRYYYFLQFRYRFYNLD